MVISETMVGGLIGRAGSNISRIRTESGAMIKVCLGKIDVVNSTIYCLICYISHVLGVNE